MAQDSRCKVATCHKFVCRNIDDHSTSCN